MEEKLQNCALDGSRNEGVNSKVVYPNIDKYVLGVETVETWDGSMTLWMVYEEEYPINFMELSAAAQVAYDTYVSGGDLTEEQQNLLYIIDDSARSWMEEIQQVDQILPDELHIKDYSISNIQICNQSTSQEYIKFTLTDDKGTTYYGRAKHEYLWFKDNNSDRCLGNFVKICPVDTKEAILAQLQQELNHTDKTVS